jgi:alpha-beta hydrolase superfamily lysophospholipase
MLYEFEFDSYNKRDKIQAWFYVPASEIKGVIQLVHGFGEHSRRYIHMISYFLDEGFVVAADDHVGHGKTAVVNDSWGDWGTAGYTTMVEDEIQLMRLAQEKWPEVPYFVFGHSMGSVITRQLIGRVGDELKGATICGTCGDFPTEPAEGMLKKLVEEGKGEESDPDALGAFLGSFFARIDDPKLGNEWICHDPYVQEDHAKDPLDAFTRPTNNQSLLYLCQMVDEISDPTWCEKIPTSLPLYFIAGDQDPFGDFGRGVYYAANALTDTGHDVTTKLYTGLRHEIHNYVDFRDEVEMGIIDFYLSQLD